MKMSRGRPSGRGKRKSSFGRINKDAKRKKDKFESLSQEEKEIERKLVRQRVQKHR